MTSPHPQCPKEVDEQRPMFGMLNLSRDDSDNMGDNSETSYFHAGFSPTENESCSSPNPLGGAEIPFDSSGARTPPRILSSNTLLYGENLVTSTRLSGNSYLAPRLSSENHLSDDEDDDDDDHPNNNNGDDNNELVVSQHQEDRDLLFSPSLHSGQTSEATTPPSTTWAPSLSPPLLHSSNTTANHNYYQQQHQYQQQQSQQQQQQNLETRSFNSKKRPPRAPIVNLRVSDTNRNENWTRHVRADSTGEGSFLSALTESSGEQLFAFPRERSNSLTTMTTPHEGMQIDISSLQQPILTDDDDDDDNHDDDDEDETPAASNDVAASTTATPFLEQTDKESIYSKRRSPTLPLPTPPHGSSTRMRQRREFEDEAREHIAKAWEQIRATNNGNDVPLPRLPEFMMQEEDEPNSKQTQTQTHTLASLIAEWKALQSLVVDRMDDVPGSLEEQHNAVRRGRDAAVSCNAGTILVQNLSTIMATLLLRLPPARNEQSSDDEESIPLTCSTISESKKPAVGSLEAAERGKSVSPSPATNQTPNRWYWEAVVERLLRPWKGSPVLGQIQQLICWLMLPSLIVSALLFFGLGNPPMIAQSDTNDGDDAAQVSLSWWFLFLGVRHGFMLLLALVSEFILIDRLALSSPTFIRLTGVQNALLLSASKGWPAVLFLFGCFSLLFVFGKEPFMHWLVCENSFGFLSSENIAGDVVERETYMRLLLTCLCTGACVSLKRLLLGFHLGRRLIDQYRDQMEAVLRKMILVSEVALYSVDSSSVATNRGKLQDSVVSGYGSIYLSPMSSVRKTSTSRDTSIALPFEEGIEPARVRGVVENKPVAAKNILEFHEASQMIGARYPFSLAFGAANTREASAKSAGEVYDRLLASGGGTRDSLSLDTIHAIAWKGGSSNGQKAEELTQLLRPDRSGNISRSDFLISIDEVYMELRVLATCMENASLVHTAYENVLNAVFYIVLGGTSLCLLGIEAVPLVMSLVGVIVASVLLAGPTCGSYLQGMAHILGRRSYDVGDKIVICKVDQKTKLTDDNVWQVEKFGILNTTVRSMMTGELATICNEHLAKTRITNLRLSDRAFIRLNLKFATNVSRETIYVFRVAVESFVRCRERDWAGICSFRLANVDTDTVCIEYNLVLRARGNWQQTQLLMERKSSLCTFCLELQKQLDMQYFAPPLPVDIGNSSQGSVENKLAAKTDIEIGATSAVSDAPFISSDNSVVSMDEATASIARLFQAQRGK